MCVCYIVVALTREERKDNILFLDTRDK